MSGHLSSTGWALAGLLSAATGLFTAAFVGHAMAPEPVLGDWRPPCATMLGAEYTALDMERTEPEVSPRTWLLGVDRSPSNADVANVQLDTAVAFAAARPSSEAIGI